MEPLAEERNHLQSVDGSPAGTEHAVAHLIRATTRHNLAAHSRDSHWASISSPRQGANIRQQVPRRLDE
jgi:hypothetical protein